MFILKIKIYNLDINYSIHVYTNLPAMIQI